ncbi:MAG TPA: GH92 family glycosyl hydrolase, partial [Chitinophagaceae bacterium]
MMQLSPDTRMADWDGSSGYHYSDSVIYGFSHTHLSGTGIPDYCDLLMMPFTGEVQWDKARYRSSFSHKNEKASPGYYEVLLDKHHIRAALTTSYRSGMHQYTFPANTRKGSVLIDLKHRDQVLDCSIEKINDREIRGHRRSRSWAQNQFFYFHIIFDQPIRDFEVNLSDTVTRISKAMAEGAGLQAQLSFNLPEGGVLKARVGISAVSAEGARQNLLSEIRNWNFNNVSQKAKAAWNKELGKIEVKGGTHDEQVSFYTALYHTMVVPNLFQDMDGQYRGTDKKIHRAADFTNYSVFSLWDTYRAYHPLMTILNQQRTRDWIRTFLHQYRNGGMLPVWELAGNETYCMIGYHSVPVIVDAWQKGVFKAGAAELLKAMTSYAESSRFGLDHYRKFGYISNEKEHESVSKTLEYAYDDWCIAQFAMMTGNDSVYRKYIDRAQFYKNVFDPATHHMRGKLQAMWQHPFDAKEINNFFTEGNSWQYSFTVPQDIETLVEMYGGRDSFASKLDELFTTSSATTGREQPDVTGLIGQYAHGNEPSHHMAYLYNYADMPWKTQELVHRICSEFYKNKPEGLIGNEDCGQMSAWFVFSAMGFYPVCPGSGEYVIGTPLFEEVKINLEHGRKFVIKAKKAAANAFYLQSAMLNGKKYTKSYLKHSTLANGGTLSFELAPKPFLQAAMEIEAPRSKILSAEIVAAPFVRNSSNKFRDSMFVELGSIDSSASIWYRVSGNEAKGFREYTGPFPVHGTVTVTAFAMRGVGSSQMVTQQFHRLPGNISIRVSSKVHPMYTAGGPEALIDGITGTKNWRAGEWQSYFDQDFEAVVDLQAERSISFLGIHVLQDIGPWILYPGEVIFYASNDGVQFTEIARVANQTVEDRDGAHETILGTEIQSKSRYIKVKAVTGGKLPSWHESAGNPSHLFIDEIIIR